jgi:hypothetical protein
MMPVDVDRRQGHADRSRRHSRIAVQPETEWSRSEAGVWSAFDRTSVGVKSE